MTVTWGRNAKKKAVYCTFNYHPKGNHRNQIISGAYAIKKSRV